MLVPLPYGTNNRCILCGLGISKLAKLFVNWKNLFRRATTLNARNLVNYQTLLTGLSIIKEYPQIASTNNDIY